MALGINNSNPSNYQGIRTRFVPKMNASQPIDREGDRVVGGTAALIFQGFAKRNIVNGETGESITLEALVYGCLGSDGKFKNIPVIVNENLLTLAFKKMGLEVPTIEKVNPLAAIPGMEGFEGLYDIDKDKLYDVVYPLRGKLFTGRMNQKQSKRGVYYFALDLETLEPVMVDGQHKALQKPDQTKPESTDFDWDE
ncbi:MAG: hypothetical protein KME46_33365 [Brasilonema angustatum HA4187-MV1]|jgi:hypothetical protein|nr:hypothetical protein [Brasilonema angustatum HA4187-MV1]